MLDIRTILCSTDFSPVSERAFMLATQLSSYFGSRLVLLHSVEASTAQSLSNHQGFSNLALLDDEDARKRGRSHLEVWLGRVPSGIKTQDMLGTGPAHASILDLAKGLPADLIVMGTHGGGRLGHLSLGSVAERVTTGSLCPVLTLRDTAQYKLLSDLVEIGNPITHQVLVPIDFSDLSRRTLSYAFDLAESFPVTVNLLHVAGFPDSSLESQKREFSLYEVERRVCDLVPVEMSRRAEIHVSVGAVAGEITRYAENIHASLIIMGVRNDWAFDESASGTTHKDVLRTSPCAVWIFPALAAERFTSRSDAGIAPAA